MYVYEGTGYCLMIDDEEMEDDVIATYNELTGAEVADLYEIDDMMELGDFCSVDNIDYVNFNGRNYSPSIGVFVLRDGYDGVETMRNLLLELGEDPNMFRGNFTVSCWE